MEAKTLLPIVCCILYTEEHNLVCFSNSYLKNGNFFGPYFAIFWNVYLFRFEAYQYTVFILTLMNENTTLL